MKSWQLKRIRIELGENNDLIINNDEDTIEFQYGKYKVKISDLNHYPFFPPKMNINGLNLSYSPALFPRRLYDEHTTKYKNKCPCCVSVYCADNWSPSLGIKDIMNEYIGFVEKLKTYQKIKIFRDTNLPDDMINEIISFLL
jgi:ubiquitin-protein ligase